MSGVGVAKCLAGKMGDAIWPELELDISYGPLCALLPLEHMDAVGEDRPMRPARRSLSGFEMPEPGLQPACAVNAPQRAEGRAMNRPKVPIGLKVGGGNGCDDTTRWVV